MSRVVIGASDRPRILCVDDEPEVLAGLSSILRKHFDVETAPGAREGLEALTLRGPFEVVVSDMRMPGMDGATFLRASRLQASDTVRILLTGQADLEAAISAVNEAEIYRFLRKPCPPADLIRTLQDAVQVSRMQKHRAAERARLIAEIDETTQVRNEIVSNVSHELRTPITIILGAVELLKMSAPAVGSEPEIDLVATVETQAKRLSDLVDAVLYTQELSQGDGGIVLSEVPVGSLLALMKSCAVGMQRSESVTLKWEAPVSLTDRIKTDCSKVSLVVRSMLSNALKFTERGTVKVVVQAKPPWLQIEVIDTGLGIKPESMPIIFEPFRQADGSATRIHGGLGLGLYIAKSYIERLGGDLQVESQVGKGSTFRVTIPGYISDPDSELIDAA